MASGVIGLHGLVVQRIVMLEQHDVIELVITLQVSGEVDHVKELRKVGSHV